MSVLIEAAAISALWKSRSYIQLLCCRLRSPNLDTQFSIASLIFLSCFCFYKFIVVCLLVFQFFWKYWKKYDMSPILIVFILEYYSSFQRKASFLSNIVFLICTVVCWLHLTPIYTCQRWVAVHIQMYYLFIEGVQIVQNKCTEWEYLNLFLLILYLP